MPQDDRTEQATPEHRREVRRKGQVARSTDVVAALVLLAGGATIYASWPSVAAQMGAVAARYLGNLSSAPSTPEGIAHLGVDTTVVFLRLAGPLLAVTFVAGLAANVAQVGLLVSGEAMRPDLSRLDPFKGLARMLSARGMVELAKSLAKTALVAYILYIYMRNESMAIVSLSRMDPATAARVSRDLLWRLTLRTGLALAVVSGLDYLYQRYQFDKSIRMTRQEVKEETRRSEGDPVIKSAFRQRHRQVARRRMMAAVPHADVVVTNPTHLAVALQYDPASMAAPVVVAKGQRLLAQRIKEIARRYDVPIVENKPVAQMLYGAAEVGDPVPVDLYQAVAEILAFVYRLRRRGFRGLA
jgi:flagellar biosynthesis protein FlhB